MAIRKIKFEERYETDTEQEAEDLIREMKEEFDITRSSITYKYRKSDEREFYIVDIRKNFVDID